VRRPHFNPKTFHLRESVGYLVKHAQAVMRDRIEAVFASQGITFQHWVVLMHLRDGLATSIAELCRETRHDSGAMTRLIDQLEERGFIGRRRQAADRRVVDLALTSAGRKMVESLIPLATETLNDVLADFSRAEVKQLQDMLRRIITRVSGLNAADAALDGEVKK
jgi:DNA-binding MarR family transcriptional regulator